ncbi:MAG TPA: hypothetical protein VN541_22475 [Tepidisphaeraceae bacterium]|nr:hypothetical protein [Tepidisphaeraceae bacterium]
MHPASEAGPLIETGILRLAMWSGPRNISTAMMRAWGNRPDTAVVDEPLYAAYLFATGRNHAGRDEVIAAGPTDPDQAIARLLGPVPDGKRVFYQKHMTHHLLPDMDRSWLAKLTNCFLLRDPAMVLTSLVKHVPDLQLADTGFPQQAEIFDRVCQWTGQIPPVLDAADVLRAPRRTLTLLCERIGVEFTDRMLSWEPGLRDTDGVWAKYWYKEVVHTTEFAPYQPKSEPVPERLRDVLEECQRHYQRLYVHRLGQ